MKCVYDKRSCILPVMIINRSPFPFLCSSTTKYILPQLTLLGRWSRTQWKGQESTVLFGSPFGRFLDTYLQQLSPGFQHTRTTTNDRKVQLKYESHLGCGFATKTLRIPFYVPITETEWSLRTFYKRKLKLRGTPFQNKKDPSYRFPVHHQIQLPLILSQNTFALQQKDYIN